MTWGHEEILHRRQNEKAEEWKHSVVEREQTHSK
jgi:hypothetical protein